MEKFTDIKLISEGRQLKEFIEGKTTIKQLAKAFNITEDSIAQYCTLGEIKNEKFKQQMEDYFQEKFDNIVKLPIKHQINEKILAIRSRIRHYNHKDESKVLEKAYKLSKYYTDDYHQLIAKGNLGVYRYNIGLEYNATEILKEVIKESKKEGYYELAVYYSVRLSYSLANKNKLQAIKALSDIEDLVNEDLSDGTLFDFHYFYGVILNRKNRFKEARKNLEKACQYANENDRMTKTYLNIALTYRKQKSYKLALEWNNKALAISTNKELSAIILNNIANIYIFKNNKERAEWFIKKAMELFDEDFDVNKKISVYDTYIEIDPTNGIKLLEEIVALLDKNNDFRDNFDLLNCIKKCFNQLKLMGDMEGIIALWKKLFINCKVETERPVLLEVKALTVDILVYINNEGRFDHEKIV